jgi:hypothetical protein
MSRRAADRDAVSTETPQRLHPVGTRVVQAADAAEPTDKSEIESSYASLERKLRDWAEKHGLRIDGGFTRHEMYWPGWEKRHSLIGYFIQE